ncbi:MAG: UDP-glucose 4-epimerase GalE [Francisellaceae bacterium]
MILITGGAGFIGSHTVLEFLKTGLDVLVLDNLVNSHETSLKRVETITNKNITFVKGDVRDRTCLDRLFQDFDIEMVIHFAALKAVGESVYKPLEYYDNNVTGTLNLLQSMAQHGVKKLVFSSSATVYGDPKKIPITEDCPIGAPTNPYGRSKVIVEQMLADLYLADNSWSIALLRYFNPIGAHESGLIGEDPDGIPNNLVPFISQVAIGKLKQLAVYGNDYPTVDGTGLRDYIHVVDLALGHLKACEYLNSHASGIYTWNLGTGHPYSVLQVIDAFEKASGVKIPYVISPRRDGDIAECWSCCEKAYKELGWKAKRDIEQMMIDSWHWQSKNPNGYRGNESLAKPSSD